MSQTGEMDQLAQELRGLSDVELARELQRRYPKPVQVTKGTLLLMSVQFGRALGERDAMIAELQREVVKERTRTESLERRVSRHADHLGRLEDRLRKQEGK